MATDRPTKPGALPQPQFPADRATAPAGLEHNTESVWALFEALRKGEEAPPKPTPAPGYEPTEPLGLAGAPGVAAASQPKATLEEVMALTRRNNRSCPLPAPWAVFYELLPARVSDGAKAPPPVDRQGWGKSSAMHKRLRLRDQIEWADRAGVLQQAHDFLARLPEEHWHHFD